MNKVGYDKWDPFQEPKDPVDIRRDKSNRTTQMLVREFLQSRESEGYSNAYGRGVLEMALGIINEDERFLGMYEFACWYRDMLKREGHEWSRKWEVGIRNVECGMRKSEMSSYGLRVKLMRDIRGQSQHVTRISQ